MVVVGSVEVGREDVGEHAQIVRLANKRAQLAALGGVGRADAVAACLSADLALEIAGDADPLAVSLLQERDVDREAGGVARAGRRPLLARSGRGRRACP